MHTLKLVVKVFLMQIAILGIILSVLATWYAWSYNTPVTASLTRVVAGTERVLTAVDSGLRVVNSGLRTALGAVNTIDGATRSAGERIVDTNFAFLILERAVGDTLFPRIVAAQQTIGAVAGTIIGVNDTLEAANGLPFVQVPTLTTELGIVSDRLDAGRTRVEEIQAGIRAIKEQKVSRPVSFITDRTEPLIADLDEALMTITATQSRITVALTRLETLGRNLPRIIDAISIGVTLVMIWLFGVQAYVLIRLYESLSGKRIDWERLTRRDPAPLVPETVPSTGESV